MRHNYETNQLLRLATAAVLDAGTLPTDEIFYLGQKRDSWGVPGVRLFQH